MDSIMNSEQLINKIRKLYPDNTEEYLFKSCCVEWIVVLKKVEDTITNQSRLSLDDPNRAFAKYRANELFVVDIVNKFDPNKSTNEIYSSVYYGNKILYIKGNIVKCGSFDENLNKICSRGIHFFETIDCAFYLELNYSQIQNGKWVEWHDNGQKLLESEYLNGKMHGKWTCWYIDGEKESEGNYLDGEENGNWICWYTNGQKEVEGEYLNGKENGKWTYWYNNGEKDSEGEYLNGKKQGKWTDWYNNGQKKSEGEYLSGEKQGIWTYWHKNGKIIDDN